MAQLKFLEVLDQKGVNVTGVAGTSMGAVLGAMYASGCSSTEIQKDLERYLIFRKDKKKNFLAKVPSLMAWLRMLSLDPRRHGVLKAEDFLKKLIQDLEIKTFEDLEIPLTVVATDYWTGEEVPYTSGPLMQPLLASCAIPGVFPPVEHDGRVLVDGSLSNCVPFSYIMDGKSVSIAIDVAPELVPAENPVPKFIEASQGMFEILIDKLSRLQFERMRPDIHVRPGIRDVAILDFDKVESVYDQATFVLPDFEENCARHGLLDS